ncbi:flagellar filament capping protein FliD [Vibrio nomapromontoriensis]|uniref:flagellar filament capping protein FliD n=1 Tax=Vibrio nomapromontoriensis TaxID=2910246 RepID=UPI003D119CF1
MSSIDPATMAQQLAALEVQPFQQRYQAQAARFQAQVAAWGKVETALSDFRSAVEAMNEAGSSIIKNSASVSQDGFFSATADANALQGSYQIFVEQLATTHQLSTSMPADLDANTVIPTTGTLDFTVNGESLSIDLSTLDTNGSGTATMSDLVSAINSDPNNPGVNATLVRSNGQTHFMLSGTETGAANTINVSASATGATWFEDAFTNTNTISSPQDAVIWLGAKDSGLKLENSSNTFTGVIDGVDLTVTKAQSIGEQPLTMEIGADSEATKEQVNGFIDAYNTLVSTLDQYTQIGGEDSERGVLAGDATLRSIESQLSGLVRGEYEGLRLSQVGLEIDRYGKMTLDSDKFEQAQKTNGAALEAMFNGKNNLLDNIDNMIDPYLSFSSGLLKGRKDGLQQSLDRIDDKQAGLDRKYDMTYNRYLKQFTQMNTIMNQMNQTMSMFG